ncbi:STAS-like domain-containing protein [Candidatus Peregrinibacteria bacterium]|nr:STAS-like domain-containing protein [Candidatus Peregrinibacteria bacterium]
MKIYLKKFGTILISRPAGKEAFLSLQPLTTDVKLGEKIEIDFEGVSVLTPSWADEFVTPLKNNFGDNVVLLNTENPSVKATLETLRKSRAA